LGASAGEAPNELPGVDGFAAIWKRQREGWQSIAKRLGWKLHGSALIDEIACPAHVDAGVVSRVDEHVEEWLRLLNRQCKPGAAMADVACCSKEMF